MNRSQKWFSLLIILFVFSCKNDENKTSNPKAILIEHFYVDGTNFAFIGTSIDAIDSVYKKNPSQRKVIDEIFGAEKFVLDSASLHYLSLYINSACNGLSEEELVKLPILSVVSYEDAGRQKCQYLDSTNISKYIVGMLDWMDKAPSPSSFDDLKKFLIRYK